jgi:hypothetical protein
MNYLYDFYTKSNVCSEPFEVFADGANQEEARLGLLFPHWNLWTLAKDGYVGQNEWDANAPTRSLLVVTEHDLKIFPRAMEPADDWFETRLDDVPKELFEQMLSPPPIAEAHEEAALYRQRAMHVLTRDWKAETIWRTVADSIGTKCTFERVPPKETTARPNGGRDGGCDDLRRTDFGLLATQIKGGSVLDKPVVHPFEVARNFFIIGDENHWRESARERRLVRWPLLKDPLHRYSDGNFHLVADRADDALVVHYLSFGKRWSGPGRLVGTSGPWRDRPADNQTRVLYVTGLDMIVLREPRHRFETRVDVSFSGAELVNRMEDCGLIERHTLDGA